MLQQTPTTSRNKKAHSVLEIDTALEEWKTSEARNSFLVLSSVDEFQFVAHAPVTSPSSRWAFVPYRARLVTIWALRNGRRCPYRLRRSQTGADVTLSLHPRPFKPRKSRNCAISIHCYGNIALNNNSAGLSVTKSRDSLPN